MAENSVYELLLKIKTEKGDVASMASALRDVGAAETALKTASAPTEQAIARVGTSSTATSAAVTNLGRQMGDVFTMAAMGASPMQILVSQGDQIRAAFADAGGATAVLSTTLGASIAVAAAAAAQVGLVYLAWQGYTDEARQADAQTRILNDGQRALQPTLDATRAAIIDVREATGDLTEAQADMERVSVRAFGSLAKATEDARASLVKLRAEQASVKTQITDLVENTGRSVFGDYAPGVAIFDALTTSSAELQGQIDAQNQTIQTAQDATRGMVAAQQLAIKADDDAKRSKDAHTAATRANTEAMRRAKEIQDEWAKSMGAWASAQRYVEEMAADDAIEKETLRYERLTAAIQDAADAGADQATVLEAQRVAALAHVDALKKIADEQVAATTSTVATNTATQGGSVPNVSAGTSPNAAVGAIGNAGPWGALIAAIINAFKDGFAAWGDMFDSFTNQFQDALANVGEDLVSNIGRWLTNAIESVSKGAQGLIRGLIGNLANIIAEIVKTIIAEVFSFDFFFGVVKALILGLVDLFKSIFAPDPEKQKSAVAAKQNELAWWNDLYTGQMTADEFWSGKSPNASKMKAKTGNGYASGTEYIARDGMYQLHKGEKVQNRSQVTSDAANMGGRARMRSNAGRLTLEIESDSFAEYFADMQRRGFVTLGGA